MKSQGLELSSRKFRNATLYFEACIKNIWIVFPPLEMRECVARDASAVAPVVKSFEKALATVHMITALGERPREMSVYVPIREKEDLFIAKHEHRVEQYAYFVFYI